MKRTAIFLGLTFFSLFCAVAASTQTPKRTAASRQRADDSADRKELAAYVADFQNNPQDTALRDRIVALAKSLDPAPEIPELAKTGFSSAAAKLKSASSADDFKAAAAQFDAVAVQAPWYAYAYFNAASAYNQAGDYDSARRELALYQSAARPADPGTGLAEELERDLDRRQDAQFQQALRQFTANPSDSARRQIIKLVQRMKTQPEIPEEARGHYVKAVVLGNAVDENPSYGELSIQEYKAALLDAPWWGEVYRKLAAAQKAQEHYGDAVDSLSFYLLTQPADARNAQDELYGLVALAQKAADDDAKRQSEEQGRRLLEEQRKKELAAIEAGKHTIEGQWYQSPTPNDFFAGGKDKPECDYVISRRGGRWEIENHCSRSNWAIANIDVQTRQVAFKMSGHEPGYPYMDLYVTFTLSDDGQKLEGLEAIYSKMNEFQGSSPVRWIRRP
jgi:hypothetical protein